MTGNTVHLLFRLYFPQNNFRRKNNCGGVRVTLSFFLFASEKPVVILLYVVIDSFHDIKEEQMVRIF